MKRKKLLTSVLSLTMAVSMLPAGSMTVAKAADAPKEITLTKSTGNNPIVHEKDDNGDIIYGGDPAVLVDGDTAYLYTGHDVSSNEGYKITEWLSYSSKDLKNWTYNGPIMKADRKTITWANSDNDAWAGQVAKYKDKYYFYYCTFTKTDGARASIGVATSDSPTGPFVDKGKPLVPGSLTTDETNGWEDIDPTVWVEKDAKGEEHRYLGWGNSHYFACELNEDMTSVKDRNGDGKITFGKQTKAGEAVDADVIRYEYLDHFTEAPWLYRRQDANGKYTGKYYLFYAHNYTEEMAYATMDAGDDLLTGSWVYGTDGSNGLLMPTTATSDTNHMSVIDFKGKTYFIYHNGMLPAGSGHRRCACIAEMKFNEDGSIQPIPETVTALDGKTSAIYTSTGNILAHEAFDNPTKIAQIPLPSQKVSSSDSAKATDLDAQWVIMDGKADPEKASYISIQSQNKPGFYLTVGSDNCVTLSQDHDQKLVAETAKQQTFKTVEGLADTKGVSFESVSNPGFYITSFGDKELSLTKGTTASACTFYIDKKPENTPDPSTLGKTNSLKSVTVGDYPVTEDKDKKEFTVSIPYDAKSADITVTLEDTKGYYTLNDTAFSSGSVTPLVVKQDGMTVPVEVFAENGTSAAKYSIIFKLNFSDIDLKDDLVYGFSFDETPGNNTVAVTTGLLPLEVEDPEYTYTDGKFGKAIHLDGSFGLDLGDANPLTDSYTISYWMNPEKLHGGVDPTLAAGVFDPQYWVNLTFERSVWSHRVSDNKWCDNSVGSLYKANTWQHVVLAVDGNTATLYLDGVPAYQNIEILEGIMTNEGAHVYFGVNGWDKMFVGSLDEMMMFKKCLNEKEVLALYNGAAKTEEMVETDFEQLKETINTINDLKEADYTAETWTALQNALQSANAVAANPNATQKEVNEANTALINARKALKKLVETDYTKLNESIQSIESLKGAEYTTKTWNAMQDALQNAQKVIANEEATQTQVDAANTALKNAIGALVKLANFDQLKASIVKAKSLKAEAYTADTWAKVDEALKNANTIAKNNNAAQADVDAASTALTTAINGLKTITNFDALNASIQKASSLKAADYTPETWKALETALQSAKDAAAYLTSTQSEVNAANTALTNAVNALKKIDTNTSKTITNPDGSTTTIETVKAKDGTTTQTATTKKKDGSETSTAATLDTKNNVTQIVTTDKKSGKPTDTKTYAVKGTEVTLNKVSTNQKTISLGKTVAAAGKTFTVTAIAANAFKSNKSLTKVTISDSVKTIGDNAFKSCKKLTTVVIGKGVKKIGKNTFKSCKKLKTITIKGNITKVGKGAFSSIKKKATIKIKASKKNFNKIKKLIKKSGAKNVKYKRIK